MNTWLVGMSVDVDDVEMMVNFLVSAADLAHAGAAGRRARAVRRLRLGGALNRAVDQRIVAAGLEPADAAQDGRGVAARLARQRADRFAALDMAQVKRQVEVAGNTLCRLIRLGPGAIAQGHADRGRQSGDRGVQSEVSRQNCHGHSFIS